MRDLTELDNSELLNLETGTESRPRSFTPAEMITCDACLRANAPIRQTCLYCGASLLTTEPIETPDVASDATPAAAADATCFYVVLQVDPDTSLDESVLTQVASRAEIKPPDLMSALRAGGALPLAQTNTSKQAEDLIPATLNTHFVPLILRERHLRAQDCAALPVHDLIKAEGVAERTGAQDIVICFVLDAERNAGHLFGLAAHGFEASGESEIAERVAFVNEQREVLICRILRNLRQRGSLGG